MWPSCRLHYASCPSVCPVCARNSQIKKIEKYKLVQTFPSTQVSGAPVFSLKGQRSRTQDVKTSKILHCVYLQAAALADHVRQLPTAHGLHQCSPVRPILLSAPETLGNGTDSHIQHHCRHLLFILMPYLSRLIEINEINVYVQNYTQNYYVDNCLKN